MYRSQHGVIISSNRRPLFRAVGRHSASVVPGVAAIILSVVIFVPTASVARGNPVPAAAHAGAGLGLERTEFVSRTFDRESYVRALSEPFKAVGGTARGAAKPSQETPAVTTTPIGTTTTQVRFGTRAVSSPMLGVLEADPSVMSADAAAGIGFATLNLSWARWEPQAGLFNASYRSTVVAEAGKYRTAGWRVAVDPGLQQPPAWALALPGGQLTDQFGTSAPTADFEFSAAVRSAAALYLTDVVQSLGPMNDYRVGLSDNGEMYYPNTSEGGWWAFTPQAQGSAAGLPRGVGVSPMVGWVPGTSTWDGNSVTQARVTRWYNWYFGALVRALRWEIDTYRAAGYRRQLELVMPGTGALPAFYDERLAADLAPGSEDSFSTLNDGAVWWKLLGDLGQATLTNTAIDDSSVDDNSGTPRGNVCQAVDGTVNIKSSQIWSWSDTRWLAYLAKLHDLPIMGETPGNTTVAELPGEMNLMRSCDFTALQWAWDYTLDESGGVSRAQLAAAFADAK
jgi:hypothetical protein